MIRSAKNSLHEYCALGGWLRALIPAGALLREPQLQMRPRREAFIRDIYHTRVCIEEKHRQAKLFWDLTGFTSPNFNLVANHVFFVGLSYALLQLQLLYENRAQLNRMTRPTLKGQLLPYSNHIIVYYKNYFGFFPTPEYTGIILYIVEPGKSKLRKRVRRMHREFLHGLQNPRGP